MKTKSCRTLAIAVLVALGAAQPALADTGTKSSRYGTEIRKAQVSGYTLTYSLIDMDQMEVTSVMTRTTQDPAPQKSNHLMVFVTSPDGRPVAEGKGGFHVTRPNQTETKEIAVAMNGGFGTDVDLPFRGGYTITTALTLPGVDLVDTFVYTEK